MIKVKNLESNTISTVTGGNIAPLGTKEVQDWEVRILNILHKISVEETVEPKNKRKKK